MTGASVVRHAALAGLLVLGLAAPAAAAPAPRIVGGGPSAAGAYPAHAELDVARGGEEALCGATLIAPEWVLTAAHCVTDEETGAPIGAPRLTVRLGSSVLGQGTEHAVDAVTRAPGFSLRTLAADAALLHLAAPATQAPLALVGAAAEARAGVVGRVIGWGTTTEDGALSATLNEVDVPIVADAVCDAAYGGLLPTATLLCAGLPDGGKDACQGDSGGPLMVPVLGAWRLAGVVSTGDGCARAGRYGVYTDLTNPALRAWIAAIAGVPVALGAPDAAATGDVPPAAGLRLARACSRRACAFAVGFPGAGGGVRATLRLARADARRLGVPRAAGVTAVGVRAQGTTRLRVAVARAVRRRLGRGTVGARLQVVAVTDAGQRSVATRGVRVG